MMMWGLRENAIPALFSQTTERVQIVPSLVDNILMQHICTSYVRVHQGCVIPARYHNGHVSSVTVIWWGELHFAFAAKITDLHNTMSALEADLAHYD